VDLVAIPVGSLTLAVHRLWKDDWLLLTAGDYAKRSFNTMTVAWGGLGVMWSKPIAMVVVRPQRYTHEFMERFPDFTLCAFPPQYRAALNLLGSTSGRDGDKIARSGLTPRASVQVRAPCFTEASLVIECRKIYRDAIDPAGFLDPGIAANYPSRDFHSLYFGEVLASRGTEEHAGR
jgi:flavin reductase (DIM6/NTAB) family NADH-FMN oxidoreductase RutF